MRSIRIFALSIGTLAVFGCGSGADTASSTPEYSYQIVNTYPHDPQSFTEGLEFHDGFLYEGTGQKGKSWVRKIALETGAVLQQMDLSSQYFGEGITIANGQLIELTYQTGKGFVYDLGRFQLLKTFSYSGEGWGLTHNGGDIYMSDGTAQIRVWDAATLAEKSRINVTEHGQPVPNVNELEWVKGEILANVWQTDKIARISPADGKVTGWIDLTGIISPNDRVGADVLNGIAYDAAKDRLFVTGKLWPKLFEIKIVKK